MLYEDFQEPDSMDNEPENEEKRRDELNLLYVAATRARNTLVLNSYFTRFWQTVASPDNCLAVTKTA